MSSDEMSDDEPFAQDLDIADRLIDSLATTLIEFRRRYPGSSETMETALMATMIYEQIRIEAMALTLARAVRKLVDAGVVQEMAEK